uniref:Uncharacterized protein n=1 Tax=Nelumbo nucifera TaxID=4432 RepID=A0A822YZ95_NELNU|nr:TPA_asm: hypothetical protein HUJ06_005188 [Nelumbo nucifera]
MVFAHGKGTTQVQHGICNANHPVSESLWYGKSLR